MFSPVPRIRQPWPSWTYGRVRAWRRSSSRSCLSSTSRIFLLLPLSPLLLADKKVCGKRHHHISTILGTSKNCKQTNFNPSVWEWNIHFYYYTSALNWPVLFKYLLFDRDFPNEVLSKWLSESVFSRFRSGCSRLTLLPLRWLVLVI